MASDLFVFDNSFFSDPFSPFSDSSVDPQHDFFQTFEDSLNNRNNNDTNSNRIQENNSADETTYSLDQIASALSSSSPPSHQLENLSICQTAQNFPNANDSDYFLLEVIKTEEYQVPLETIAAFNNPFVPQNNTADNVVKLMQRSYSSNSFDGKPNFFFHQRFDSLMESPNMQSQVMNPPENNLSTGQMRRVCSTGDLQVHNTPSKNTLSSSPLSTDGSFLEEANFKVGRYSAEERKERIHRYRAKRNQRNFNKTIKYACRKTLADNRPRIRGRFARNDEAVEIPKASMFTSTRYEDEDDLWIEGFQEEDDEGSAVGRSTKIFYNNLGSAAAEQYQYYSY
ncbi:zinc finger protein CONSTANS-LIKE 1 [Coffea eugenioides]|uniref:Uncharacterized protein isoform X1 n=1 Tax=Coffea arabica TaxID=13443 RepID=A0A6P6TRQ1_COFAR|nr:zinc finger protein CONSTANS-LIKE 1-like isoform X1 [Coffea arabica]XP_027183394.1 zinc finger protein CONSTANS-LIKE 1 [Coffea eugenioides]